LNLAIETIGERGMWDANDLPILVSAMVGDVDVLLTGDKDFDAVNVERPAIPSPAKFMELYG
jgi:hypothetical protein